MLRARSNCQSYVLCCVGGVLCLLVNGKMARSVSVYPDRLSPMQMERTPRWKIGLSCCSLGKNNPSIVGLSNDPTVNSPHLLRPVRQTVNTKNGFFSFFPFTPSPRRPIVNAHTNQLTSTESVYFQGTVTRKISDPLKKNFPQPPETPNKFQEIGIISNAESNLRALEPTPSVG